jgi:hypothetical protein
MGRPPVLLEDQPEFISARARGPRGLVRKERGTRRPDLIRDRHDPNCFHLDEEYIDEAAFAAHADGRWFRGFFERIIGKVEDGPCTVLKGFVVN